MNALAYTSPLFAEGFVVAMVGYRGSSLAVEPSGRGDVTATHRLWHAPKTQQRIGSGVISQGHIYILNDLGVAECLELGTGKPAWVERLKGPGSKSDCWSSMVLAQDRIYALNHSGDAFVLKASPQFEVLATNSIGETTLASPAVAHSEIFIRSYENLWCLGGD
jgi:outer membrane protein assembly factor BamB